MLQCVFEFLNYIALFAKQVLLKGKDTKAKLMAWFDKGLPTFERLATLTTLPGKLYSFMRICLGK